MFSRTGHVAMLAAELSRRWAALGPAALAVGHALTTSPVGSALAGAR